jgi:ferredoxin
MTIMPNIRWTTQCRAHILNVSTGAKTRSDDDVPGGTMHLILDRPRCEGHGLCEEAAPDLLHLDDEGDLVIDVETVEDGQVDTARAAVRVCPVAALRLE